MARYKSVHTGAQIDSGVARALPGGEIDQSTFAKLDWEGLINPEFTVAQAGIGGNHGSVPYAADCWKLISGTVSAAPGGGLVLNGVIRQTRETAVGLDAVASINVTSGTATATYDDAAKQFDITSSGGTIKRAHLGLTAITDWAKVPKAKNDFELFTCQKYFQTGWVETLCFADDASSFRCYIPYVAKMRTQPVVAGYVFNWVMWSNGYIDGSSFPITSVSVNSAGEKGAECKFSSSAATMTTSYRPCFCRVSVSLCADLQ